ncbi:hypothetical protein F5146DRAFT_1209255 [Armillaria mellea]|nr:hypothetical protein F5146DRAFT_1209255 [Armillaria mellea]
MRKKPDLLVLGAMGTPALWFTCLTCRPAKSRREDALNAIVTEFSLSDTVDVLQVDVMKPDQVEAAAKMTKVVINILGLFWMYGRPVVRSLKRNSEEVCISCQLLVELVEVKIWRKK